MAIDIKPGIYKTTKYMPGQEADVGPNLMVLIRTDAEFAPASVLKPVRNEHNQWNFSMPGFKVPASSMNWLSTLKKLPHEGFYRLKEEHRFGDGGYYAPNAIVQLGYTPGGDPILFIARRRSPIVSNDLWFSDKGVKVDLGLVDRLLEPLAWLQEKANSES